MPEQPSMPERRWAIPGILYVLNVSGCSAPVRPDELKARFRDRLDALSPAPRAELLHVFMLPDFDRADRIGEFWGNPRPGPSPGF
jgi:hypothetical protein